VITLTLYADVKAKLHENDFNDAFKMMSHLKELYKPSTDTEFFMLMRELLGLRYADFNTTEDYLSHLRSLNDRITRTKVNLCHGWRLSCLMGNPYLTFGEMRLPIQH
jgi:hypothetical protein